jgi:ABC-type glycerol-3-phosphate transport system substrate-binding protein
MKLRAKHWVIFTVIGLLLAACGGGDGDGGADTTEADGGSDTTAAPGTTEAPATTEAPMEEVTLTLLTDDNEQNSEYADALIAAYMEAHPNVTIEHELRPGVSSALLPLVGRRQEVGGRLRVRDDRASLPSHGPPHPTLSPQGGEG